MQVRCLLPSAQLALPLPLLLLQAEWSGKVAETAAAGERQVAAARAMVAAREGDIAQLQQEAAERDAAIGQLQQMVEELHGDNAELARQVGGAELSWPTVSGRGQAVRSRIAAPPSSIPRPSFPRHTYLLNPPPCSARRWRPCRASWRRHTSTGASWRRRRAGTGASWRRHCLGSGRGWTTFRHRWGWAVVRDGAQARGAGKILV